MCYRAWSSRRRPLACHIRAAASRPIQLLSCNSEYPRVTVVTVSNRWFAAPMRPRISALEQHPVSTTLWVSLSCTS
jgi:ureidoglycolate hydrolase